MKAALIKGRDCKSAMLDAGYKESTAKRSTMNKSVKICRAEIVQELDKKGMIEEAYKVLRECLYSKHDSNKIASAQAILKFTEGEKIRTEFLLTPDEQSELEGIRKHLIPQAN